MAEPETITGAVEAWVADDIAITDGTAISSWVGRVAASNLAQATGGKQPIYRTSGINSQPAVDFDGTDDILRYAGTLSTALSGHVFVVVRYDNPGAASNDLAWSSSDEATTNHWLFGDHIASGSPAMDMFQQDGGSGDEVFGGTNLASATDYLLEWSSSGSAWVLRKNGAAESLSVATGANSGDWFGDVSGRDNFVLGAFKRTTEGGFLDGKIAAVVIVDGTISDADRFAFYDWIEAKYGITMPDAPAPSTSIDNQSSPRGVNRGVSRGVA